MIHFEEASAREPPAELTLTDPAGRRCSVSPKTGSERKEIPNCKISREKRHDTWTGKPVRDIIELVVARPIEGTFELRLTGTEKGGLLLGIVTMWEGQGPALMERLDGWISPGDTYRYALENRWKEDVAKSRSYWALRRTGFRCETYRFDGFLSPLGEKDTRVFRPGDRIPVKFRLNDWAGKAAPNVSALLALTPIDGIPPRKLLRALPGEGRLSYDSRTERYSYDLRTDSLWAGRWELTVTLQDGSQHRETFQLREREGP